MFKLTLETFNKFHANKIFICVDLDCIFKNLPFYQNSNSSDYYSFGLKMSFPSIDQLKCFNNYNSIHCGFKNLLLSQNSNSSDYYAAGPKSSFPNNGQLKFFNNCNILEISKNNEEDLDFKLKLV